MCAGRAMEVAWWPDLEQLSLGKITMQASDQLDAGSGPPVRASASLDRWTGVRMPIQQFLPLAIRLASELAALHARGAIHQDIRPSSIRFDADLRELALVDPPIAGPRAPGLSE